MTTYNEVITQEVVNRMNSLCEAREKSREFVAGRIATNSEVQALIMDLSRDAEDF